jgi:hypothetical protein
VFATLLRNLSRKSQNVAGRPLRTVPRSTRLEVEALEERSVPSGSRMPVLPAPVAGGTAWHLPVSTPVHAREMLLGGAHHVGLQGGKGVAFAGGARGESAAHGGSIDGYITRSSGEEIPQ